MLMNSQEDLAESAFTQLFHNFVLTEAVGGVEIFAPWGIEGCIIFDELEVVFEVLGAFFVEKS